MADEIFWIFIQSRFFSISLLPITRNIGCNKRAIIAIVKSMDSPDNKYALMASPKNPEVKNPMVAYRKILLVVNIVLSFFVEFPFVVFGEL